MRVKQETVDQYNFIEKRIITLGEITVEETNNFLQKIHEINDNDKSKKSKKPIKLIINSPGGEVYSAFAIVDAIKNSTTPIHTICLGHAMSAAFFVYIVGHSRYAGKLATFMYHDISAGQEGNITTHKRELKESERMVNIMDKIVSSHTMLTEAVLSDIRERHRNQYFDVNEAKKMNIVDIIL